MTNPAVVKFNVGGTRYEVSRSLVNSFPNTLLAKSASTQWNDHLNAEIFIERDGHRFQYVLDYMRDGRIYLPVGASKDAVLVDLKYYGFENIKEGNLFKFNVGGTRYEVSRSLVNSYPNTLLAVSASNELNDDPNAEIFIERDGHRFQYVLDYMRDGRIYLPVGASKDAVLEDLKYYGFKNVNVEVILDAAATTIVFGESTLLVEELLTSWKKNLVEFRDTIQMLESLIYKISRTVNTASTNHDFTKTR